MADWIYTCRAGFEGDLVEELGRGARVEAPALVAADRRADPWPVFARTGFPRAASTSAEPAVAAAALSAALGATRGPFTLAAWVPDTEAMNAHASEATRLGEAVLAALPEGLALKHVAAGGEAVRYGGQVAQVCLAAPGRVLLGVVPAQELPTLAPGGRARARAPRLAPSRAARKLVEALEWFGRAPEAGENCVDLGAAPGGWTAVLLERRARVIAVDPARLDPALARQRGLRHVQASAFEYAPDEPVDWLFCDMAWRPLEVAALLAKWGRRRWAQALVANVKLPMKQRLVHVRKVLDAVGAGGWRDVRGRHLYHDRDEFTLTGWRT